MSTTSERKPGVSNWFSSLRRQPKKHKNIKKPLQKSCVDLSAITTENNSSPSSSVTSSPRLRNGLNGFFFNRDNKLVAAIKSVTPPLATISKTETLEIDQEKEISGINGTQSGDGANGTGAAVKSPDQLHITTTTKITQTTVITKQSHRVGMIFDEDGELISNLETYRNLANNLNNQLVIGDGCGSSQNHNNNNINTNYNNQQESFNGVLSRPFKSNSLEDDIEFIDSSSSLSDIGGSRNDLYFNYNTLPKSCSTCKNKAKSRSDWNISVKKQIKDELCEVVAEMESLDSQEDCKHSNKDKQMSIGRKKFNMDPKKGIEYLCENHLLRMDAQDIAHFLYKGEGLNKTAIGDYLGEKNDFNEQVLKAFVELHDFTNLILVQALRQFLWSFRLPGEAQKIDRMMECFAQRYCQLNPDIFTNTDTCYVLSFAIIMLNTSLHNPSVKDKPAVEQFISMNRGINNGGDLPRELLVSLYESIRTEPFKIPQDDGNDLMHTFFNPDKEGWLWKQGGRYKSWKRRWFILNDNCLYYFEYTTDKEPRGIIPLENILVREIQDRSKPHCFELYACGGADIIKACKTDSEGKVVEGKHSVYRMSAATDEDKQEWIKCLTQSISHNPFYDILVQRKKKALSLTKS